MRLEMDFDPRVKLLLFCVTSCFVMAVTGYIPNLCLGLFIAIMMVLNGKWEFAIKGFFIQICMSICAMVVSNIIPGMLGLLILGICVISRMIIPIVMAFALVFQTTSTSMLMASLRQLKVPMKAIIPVVIMFRFVPTVMEEHRGIRKAMAFRGISFSFSYLLRHPVNSIELILIPLLFSASSVIEELAAASLARGLDSNRKRSCLIRIRMKLWDYVALAITIGFAGFWILGYGR